MNLAKPCTIIAKRQVLSQIDRRNIIQKIDSDSSLTKTIIDNVKKSTCQGIGSKFDQHF